MNGIVVKIRGIGKPRMTRSDAWKKRPCVTKYWEYKDKLVEAANREGFVLGDEVELAFFFKPPKSMSRKKTEALLDSKWHKMKPDLDNLVKGVLDCLKENDQSVYRIETVKYWGREDLVVITNI